MVPQREVCRPRIFARRDGLPKQIPARQRGVCWGAVQQAAHSHLNKVVALLGFCSVLSQGGGDANSGVAAPLFYLFAASVGRDGWL